MRSQAEEKLKKANDDYSTLDLKYNAAIKSVDNSRHRPKTKTLKRIITFNNFTNVKHQTTHRFYFHEVGDTNSISIGGRRFTVIFHYYDSPHYNTAGLVESKERVSIRVES
jgi:hypothetical protein